MATYAVTFSEADNHGESHDRFKTKPPAEGRFREVAATGQFVRLVVWNNNAPTELNRANTPPTK
jgi:hypothetical protein